MDITTVGLDLAKNVFQVHGVNAAGDVIVRRRLRRAQVFGFFAGLAPCLVGMEACGTAHFWARELVALGHEVKIIPPSYVKAYVRRGKNDAADAAANCEAVARPNMRFVPVKTEAQQAALMLHKARELLIRQQTMLVNALRAHMAELGMTAPQGRGKVENIIAVIEDDEDESIPALAKAALRPLVAQLRANEDATAALDAEIKTWHKGNAASQRLATIPGIGFLTASAIAATVPDPSFSAQAANSLPGWGSFPGRIPVVARTVWAGYRSRGTLTFVGFWLSAQPPCYAMHGPKPHPERIG